MIIMLIDGKTALALVQGEDLSGLLDGVRARLMPHRLFLGEPSRELGTILSGMAFLLTEDAYHARLVWRSFLRLVFALCSAFLFALSFALALAFLFALPFSLPFVSASTSTRVASFPSICHAPLSVRLVHRFPLNSESITRSVQRAWAILDPVDCVPVLLRLSCPGACPNSVLHVGARVVPIPPRPTKFTLASWAIGVTGVRAALSASIVVSWCIRWSC